MNRFELKDLYLGENDGKKESIYREDFEKFFVDIDEISTKINNRKYFVVLGRKGSGKTYFGQYIKKISKSEALHFCDVKSYKDFKFQELIQLQSGDITPNEYYEIWRWLILLDLAKLCLLDEGIQDSEAKNKLIGFFDANYNAIDIDTKKVVEITKKEQVRGGFLKSFIDLTDALKAEEGTYLDYIDNLESVVIELLSQSSSKYTTIYDELDDRFRNDDYYKNSIISLLKAADHINLKILEKGLNSKVIILLRTDIFSILNDPDLNKIKRINTITISWGDTSTIESALIKMIILKAKKSSALLNALSDEDVFKKLFPDKVHRINPAKYILERTFFRPRDIVTMLNLVIDKYPSSTYFGWKSFTDISLEYSKYLQDEVKNEMYGHYDDKQIETIFRLLKNYNEHYIQYPKLKKYYEKNKFHYKNLDMEEMLIGLFKFNAVGNKWFNKYRNREYFSWAHRDDEADLDFDKTIVIHSGLREALSM